MKGIVFKLVVSPKLLIAILFIWNVISIPSYAYEKESEIKVVLIGKVAKFITWSDSNQKEFIITVLNNPFEKLFESTYLNRKIKKTNVVIRYIDDISQLDKTHILYIPKVNSESLIKILEHTYQQNILTVSDMKGFASKGGIIQIYFASQKPKLKINLANAKTQKLKIKSSLLRIADVIKGGS